MFLIKVTSSAEEVIIVFEILLIRDTPSPDVINKSMFLSFGIKTVTVSLEVNIKAFEMFLTRDTVSAEVNVIFFEIFLTKDKASPNEKTIFFETLLTKDRVSPEVIVKVREGCLINVTFSGVPMRKDRDTPLTRDTTSVDDMLNIRLIPFCKVKD